MVGREFQYLDHSDSDGVATYIQARLVRRHVGNLHVVVLPCLVLVAGTRRGCWRSWESVDGAHYSLCAVSDLLPQAKAIMRPGQWCFRSVGEPGP